MSIDITNKGNVDDDMSAIVLNPKCVYFSALLMAGYTFLPEKDITTIFLIPLIFLLLIVIYFRQFNCSYFWSPQHILISILASLSVATLYWVLPRRSIPVYIFIFAYGYIGMAIYDYLFDCDTPLQHGFISMTQIFKPKKKLNSKKRREEKFTL